MVIGTVLDPESDPVISETFCRIWIQGLIRNKSFLIRIRAALIRNEFETKLIKCIFLHQIIYHFPIRYHTDRINNLFQSKRLYISSFFKKLYISS
jgi:hypothetical protein